MRYWRACGVILTATILFSGCSIDWDDGKDKKITELEKQLERSTEQSAKITDLETKLATMQESDMNDEWFKRRTECLAMESKMLAYAKKSSPQIWQIDEVFYSNKTNGCYFVARETRNIDWNVTRDFRLLFDYFWQKKIGEEPLNISWEPFDWILESQISVLKNS